MTEIIRKKLSDSAGLRWTAMFIVAFTMMMGYFLTDVASPLESMLEASAPSGMGWTSTEYGFFAGSYGIINVYLLMLFFGGLILDRMGIRFTGIMATALMFIGALVKYYAISHPALALTTTYVNMPIFGFSHAMVKNQVLIAALGFSIFGVGCEITGITVSKIITKWFTGHELALAMGIQVALARLGTAAALMFSPKIALAFHNISAPILLGVVLLLVGFLSFFVYCVMDNKFDKQEKSQIQPGDEESKFKFSDLLLIFKNTGFWLITFLCLLFYSGVFPFLKFAAKLMQFKYGVDIAWSGLIPSILPFGTIILTPVFGIIYDKIGKGATLMIIGSVLLTACHVLFALPILNTTWFAVLVMICLGISFSLVPSAMWPSVPKIIPMKQLGSAYAIIFYIQNIGLTMVPMLIGKVIQNNTAANGIINFTVPMSIFAGFGIVAILLAIALRILDGKKHYGLEQANIKKQD
jgi:MFS family permease